jgi:hypothetical protein
VAEMTVTEAKDHFDSHVGMCINLITYLALIPETFPHVFTATDFSRLNPSDVMYPWMNYISNLHGRDVYANPPNPITFLGSEIPDEDISDCLQKALGRNHPLFDAVHAPFTRPLNTQIALISVNYVWDAYDTFIKVVIGNEASRIKELCAQGMLTKESPTDKKLEALGLLQSNSDEWDNALILAGKALRSSFAHHFGLLSDEMKVPLQAYIGSGVRIDGDGTHFEIQLFFSKKVVEAIQLKAAHVLRKWNEREAGLNAGVSCD